MAILTLHQCTTSKIWYRTWDNQNNSAPLTPPETALQLILGQTIPETPSPWGAIDGIMDPQGAPWYGQALYESGGKWPEVLYGLHSLSDGFIVSSQWIENWKPNDRWPFPPPHLRPRFQKLDSNLRQAPAKWSDTAAPGWQETRKEAIRILGDLHALFSGQLIPPCFLLKYTRLRAGLGRATFDVSPIPTDNATLNIEKPLELGEADQNGIAPITTLRPDFPSFWLFNSPPQYKHHSEHLVVVSPNYQSVLEEITRIFRVRSPKSILFIGPPGCGKEILFDTIAHGLGKGDGRMSLAGKSMESERDAEEFRTFLKSRKRQTIVIDEVDKCHHSVRSWLLRVLETDTIEEKDDLENTTWVMAASRPVYELRQEVKPLDF
ncbi:MAG: ATP-binding protein [Nitrospirota bacterium]|nr:ATP-binding protein [Nitrospirota bacterium]